MVELLLELGAATGDKTTESVLADADEKRNQREADAHQVQDMLQDLFGARISMRSPP